MSSPHPYTIVEYYGKQCSERCGYCKNNKTSQSQSMWAHSMTVEDYQALIDRGWRRSGQYCYKPTMSSTCCPSYTIRCDVRQFQCTKSQKKIIKKVNRYLATGARSGSGADSSIGGGGGAEDGEGAMQCEVVVPEFVKSAKRITPKMDLLVAENSQSIANSADNKTDKASKSQEQVEENVAEMLQTEVSDGPSKQPRKKAKLLRQERNQMKRQLKGLPPIDPAAHAAKVNENNAAKSLEQLIDGVEDDAKHKLKVIMLPAEKSWSNTPQVHGLYKKYQLLVHNDTPSRLTTSSFERFLVRSPFKLILVPVTRQTTNRLVKDEFGLYNRYQSSVHDDKENEPSDFAQFLVTNPFEHAVVPGGPSIGFGTFHQQYWLDDQLIAVGVLDILPSCVTAVYFFYDPDYRFLSLGSYSSFREIALTQQLMRECPSIANYYMGYYIHSCPKMRYKAHIKPSFLLCPETYTWHLLDDSLSKRLDAEKYQRLNADLDATDVDWFVARRDLDQLTVLCDMRVYMTYRQYAIKKSIRAEERNEIVEYGELVGRSLSCKILSIV